MRRIRPYLPHAAIVLANMYTVFFLIDRVNTTMNFIDNRYTRLVLALMLLIGGYDLARLRMVDRRDRRTSEPMKKALCWGSLVLGACSAVFVLIGALFSRSTVMLNGLVKGILLLTDLLTVIESVRLIRFDRAMARRRLRSRRY